MKYSLSIKVRCILVLILLGGIVTALFIFPKSSIESTMPLIESSEKTSGTAAPDIMADDIAAANVSLLSPINQAFELMSNQEVIDRNLLIELNSNVYSLDNPLVVVNPYGLSPLTALVMFKTEEPVKIEVHIGGKSPLASIDYGFPEYSQEHTVPVYGLYPDTVNILTFTAINKSNEIQKSVINVQTEPLMDSLQAVTNISYIVDEEKYSPGFNFMFNMIGIADIKRALDINGDTRWYLNLPTLDSGGYNKDGTITICTGNYKMGEAVIYNMSLLGRILDVYASDYGVHHDIEFTDRNTMLITGSSGETSEDFIYEIDNNTGEIIKTLDYKTILQRSRVLGVRGDNVDWMHMNSIVQDGEDIIVSSNFQLTVIKNSLDGEIKWMLCDPQGYYARFQPYILKPIGTDFEYPYNQHAVEILPDYDNNQDTIDILLFDNGLSRNTVNAELQRAVRANEITEPALYSRLVHYRIDEKNMTVEQIWQYGKERPEIFSSYRGNANLLPNGNILGCFNVENYPATVTADPGISNNRSVVYTEVDQDKNVIWECFSTSRLANNYIQDYRVERLPIYSENTEYVDLNIPANNLIPKEILSRYENQ